MTRPDNADLLEIERTAVELAQLAGAEIQSAVGGLLSVRYKTGADDDLRDPVSEIDQRVEELIRARLAERFADHDIIGEEIDERGPRDSGFTWAVDPIDGTTNFVNGFPMFAATIGVLHDGEPVAGAIWCTTGHALRAGVYHAHAGAPLLFDGQPVTRAENASVKRRVAGVSRPLALVGPYDVRKTGSAAIECALVACGVLAGARFEMVNLWDVAGGVALVQAAGGAAAVGKGDDWLPMERFEAVDDDLRGWRRPLAIGDAAAIEALTQAA